jgi:excisionase family DNA binding protein
MPDKPSLYSLDQVAERLGLHVRTIRGYVRNGSLKAVRIGKQYRVAREDLELLAGPQDRPAAPARHRCAEASSVVQVDAVTQDTARRMMDRLSEAVKAPRDDGSALRIETIYDQGHAQMKVIVIGTLPVAAHIFRLLDVILEE